MSRILISANSIGHRPDVLIVGLIRNLAIMRSSDGNIIIRYHEADPSLASLKLGTGTPETDQHNLT